MITDFISVYEDAISVEYCEKFIDHIEHYIDNGIMCYEPFGFDPVSYTHLTLPTNDQV